MLPRRLKTIVVSTFCSNECNHLHHKGIRNTELYYNVCEKNHVVGTSGFGSVTMRDGSNPYVEAELSMDNSSTQPVLDEDLTPTNCGLHAGNRRPVDNTGPSRSRGSAGKRKQREATNEMTYVAMQEIVSHFCSQSQSSSSNDQSSRPDHLLMCMNIITEMGIPLEQRTIMWHYFRLIQGCSVPSISFSMMIGDA
ncbi:hypothetical protein TIFTF001_014252 [Ficus carica]|uniref:Uncharacterized protein n=1 Tax=Ficus carica TaxID=3494 RepID=A0AA88A2E8_FICCA|nr:hypothetical protein TIFTF001_014252 [Ficus carica]